jgi:hypothetical protein
MVHLFINHHFFYGENGFGAVLKGPSEQRLRQQLSALTTLMRPAASIFDDLDTDEAVFSITVDDGSRSVLDILPVFREFGITPNLCICSLSTLHQGVLLIHKINF